MVKLNKILIALIIFVLPLVIVKSLVFPQVLAKNSSVNNDKLKELIQLAQVIKSNKHASESSKNKNYKTTGTKKTTTRIVSFSKELTSEEIKALESKYNMTFSDVKSRRARYVVTPHNEQLFDTLQNDERVKGSYNNDTFQVSAPLPTQVIDWGISKMNIPSAWYSNTPSTGTNVVIALLDTGVQLNHPDLVGSILAGGHDYVNNDEDPNDDQGHGTMMAGAMVAANNTIGVVGAAYTAKILPLKVCNASEQCDSITIADAIDDAAAADVDIINLSLAGSPNELVHQSIVAATNAGIVVVAAAGNGFSDGCMYPAAYSEVICVGAATETDNKADFSNYGNLLDVVAPGVNVHTTTMGSTYGLVDGTSISTAYYSGAAALVEARLKELCISEPSNVACSDMRSYTQILLNEVTVRDIGIPGKDSQFGNGVLDLSQFFAKTTTVHVSPQAQVRVGTTYNQVVTITNNNTFAITLNTCKITSKNTSRTQTVPSFTISQLTNGENTYLTSTSDSETTSFSLLVPIQLSADEVATFSYTYIPSAGSNSGDSISYSFVCGFDKSSTPEVESYRTDPAKVTTTISQPLVPATLTNVYFTFGSLKYNQTVSSSQLRAGDMVYLKNFDAKKLRLTQFFLYDYTKHGTQGFTKTYKTYTSFFVRTNYLLTGKKKYAYVAEFQDIASGIKIKKYFVFYTK